MTSWTLDNTTFHYWTLSETGEIVWGYPKHGDEVIIDDRFKYIFKATKKESNTWEEIRYTSTGFTPANYNRGYIVYTGVTGERHLRNDMLESTLYTPIQLEVVTPEENTPNDEISAYMREAQQMMNNGR